MRKKKHNKTCVLPNKECRTSVKEGMICKNINRPHLLLHVIIIYVYIQLSYSFKKQWRSSKAQITVFYLMQWQINKNFFHQQLRRIYSMFAFTFLCHMQCCIQKTRRLKIVFLVTQAKENKLQLCLHPQKQNPLFHFIIFSVQLTSCHLSHWRFFCLRLDDRSPPCFHQSAEVCPWTDPVGSGGHREEGLSWQIYQL